MLLISSTGNIALVVQVRGEGRHGAVLSSLQQLCVMDSGIPEVRTHATQGRTSRVQGGNRMSLASTLCVHTVQLVCV